MHRQRQVALMQPTPPEKLIEVRVRSITQLFNSMDPSPFHEKDLDADAEEFITGWAMEHPLEQPLVLAVHLEVPPVDANAREIVMEAVHHFFAYRASVKQRELKELLRRGRASLAIALAFLTACVAGGQLIQSFGASTLTSIISEGMLIGGWVAMWRPLEIFLYDWWPLRHMRRVYVKLSRIEVRVTMGDSE